MNNWKNICFVLSGVIIGCGAAAGTQHASATYPANAAAPRWQQKCYGYDPANKLNADLKRSGEAGWELVSVDYQAQAVCYKRPAP